MFYFVNELWFQDQYISYIYAPEHVFAGNVLDVEVEVNGHPIKTIIRG